MIRLATLNDLKNIEQLELKIFGQTLGLAFLQNELLNHDSSSILVLEEDRHLIGYLGYRMTDDKAEILNFLIDTPYQGRGYGRKMMSYVFDQLTLMGASSLILEVRSSNTPAIKLYESMGFIPVLTRKNYYQNEDALVYIKEFSS